RLLQLTPLEAALWQFRANKTGSFERTVDELAGLHMSQCQVYTIHRTFEKYHPIKTGISPGYLSEITMRERKLLQHAFAHICASKINVIHQCHDVAVKQKATSLHIAFAKYRVCAGDMLKIAVVKGGLIELGSVQDS